MKHFLSHVRYYCCPSKLADTQLTYWVKLSDGVYFVTKEFYPVRIVQRETKDIYNSSSDCILSWLVNEVDLFKTVFHENLIEKIQCVVFA